MHDEGALAGRLVGLAPPVVPELGRACRGGRVGSQGEARVGGTRAGWRQRRVTAQREGVTLAPSNQAARRPPAAGTRAWVPWHSVEPPQDWQQGRPQPPPGAPLPTERRPHNNSLARLAPVKVAATPREGTPARPHPPAPSPRRRRLSSCRWQRERPAPHKVCGTAAGGGGPPLGTRNGTQPSCLSASHLAASPPHRPWAAPSTGRPRPRPPSAGPRPPPWAPAVCAPSREPRLALALRSGPDWRVVVLAWRSRRGAGGWRWTGCSLEAG